jgi:hypothetical protein
MSSRYLFIIYSCKKNLEQAENIYQFLVSKKFQEHCQIYIIYGNDARKEFQESIALNHILEEHHIVLNTPDDYYSLNKKTLSMIHAVQYLFPTILGLFKCDDDIIPNVVHLTYLITSAKLASIDYCGNKVNNEHEYTYNFNNNPEYSSIFPVVRYCGGPMYYISKHSLDTFTNIQPIKLFPAEDIMVGYHLNHASIEPSPLIESLYSDYVSDLNKISFHNYKHDRKYIDIVKVPNLTSCKSGINEFITPLGILCPQINGGLGNQLFKLGATISLAREYNRELIISKAHFIPNEHQSANKTMKTLEKLFCTPEMPLQIIDGDIPGGYYVYKAGCNESFQYVDLSSRIPKDIIQSRSNLMIDGYFINPRYLPNDYPNLISITPTLPVSELIQEYGNFDNTYFIHVRLGDYVGHELYRISLDSYYKDCIAKIKYSSPSAQFIVCTNEYSKNLERYLEHIKQITDYKLQSPKDDELDTLYIMSQCRGGICSNSTLSWFGSYFQNSRLNSLTHLEAREHIYMPYPWVNKTWHGFTDENTSDIYPVWATVYNTITCKFRNA